MTGQEQMDTLAENEALRLPRRGRGKVSFRQSPARRHLLKLGLVGLPAFAGASTVLRHHVLGQMRLGSHEGADAPSMAQDKRFRLISSAAALRNPIGSLTDNDSYGPVAAGILKAVGADPTPGYLSYGVQDYPDRFTLLGGRAHLRYGHWQALSVTYPDHHPAPNTGRVAFMTDAASFDLLVGASASASYRVIVDGRYVSREGLRTSSEHGVRQVLHVELPDSTAATAPMRRVDVEMFSPEGSFGGIALPEGGKLAPISTIEPYRIACFGDSLSTGTGCVNQNDGWNVVAGYLLGSVELDMVQMALGGTGFLRDGPAWRGVAHLGDLTAQPVDEVWIELGMNDAGLPLLAIGNAALRLFRSIRSLLPQAPLVVCGLARDDSGRAQAVETVVGKAFAFWKDKRSMWIPFQTVGEKLFTGNVGGIGSFASRYGGGTDGRDNTHPNISGHLHMARTVARRRRLVSFA